MKKLLLFVLVMLFFGTGFGYEKIVHFILDESGSMEIMKSDMVTSINKVYHNIENKDKIKILLSKFNDGGFLTIDEINHKCIDLLHAEDYNPNDNTPLFDSIHKAVIKSDEFRESKICDKCGVTSKTKVLYIIITDGQENASRMHDKSDTRKLIEDLQKEGCEFVYLGANQDSWGEGIYLKIKDNLIQNWNTPDMIVNPCSTSINNFIENIPVELK